MNEYLDLIRKYLNVLSNDIIEKEINNIKLTINDKIDKNEAKKIAKNILEKYGINSEIVLKEDNFFKRKISDLSNSFNQLLNIMSKNSLKSNLKIIFDIILLIVFICLCKIPFIVIRNIGESLIKFINISVIYDIWDFAIEFVYIIVAIMIFINVFPKWFKNLKYNSNKEVINKEPDKFGKDLESVSLTKKENK